MKRIVSLWFAVFVSISGTSVNAQIAFRNILRTPTFENLTKIAYADATTMYAIGDGATFLHTTNGGAALTASSVTTVSSGMECLYGCDFSNALVGAVCGAQGLVAVTTNGGGTWTRTYIPGAGTLRDIKVDFTTGRGFAIEEKGIIHYTSTLGASWSNTLDLQPADTLFPDKSLILSARLNSTTYVTLADDGTLWKTVDAGQTWTDFGNVGGSNCSAMFFFDATHGWIGTKGTLFATTDGGQTWPIHTTMPKQIPIKSIHFYDASNGGVSYSDGSFGGVVAYFFRSKDGGRTLLTNLPADTANGSTAAMGGSIVGLNSFMFGSAQVVWAVGAAGDVRRSANSGHEKSWSGMTQGSTGPTVGMSFFDDNHGVYSTQTGLNSGSLFGTVNGGSTWTPPAGAGENAYFVARMTDASSAVAFGPTSAQYTTNNGGSWKACSPWPTGGQNAFKRLFQVPTTPVVVYAVGSVSTGVGGAYNGGVMVSTDAGHAWISRTPDEANAIGMLGISFQNATTGFVCGLQGFLLKTTDAGGTYTKKEITDVYDDFSDIAFATPTNGWMTSYNEGHIYGTTDGGESWQLVDIGARDTLLRIVFATSMRGWISGNHGQLFQTKDGGVTWQRINAGTDNSIEEICYTPRTGEPTALWISGGKGMILRGDLFENAVGDPPAFAQPGALALGESYPNPLSLSRSSMSIGFDINASATARLDVINLLGERVRTITRGSFVKGSYTAVWDGRDDHGALVAAGTYFYSLSSGSAHATKAIVVTH